MKALYTHKRLANLSIGLLLLVMLTMTTPAAHAWTNNNTAFIITTVDNIKGQYSMQSFQKVCSSNDYAEYEFILMNGKKGMFDKNCICEKYDQYQATGGSPLMYKFKFWQVVKDCEVPYSVNEMTDVQQGGVKEHPEALGFQEEEDFNTKYQVNEFGALEMSVADFSIYPNPAKEFFMMDYQLNEGDRIEFHMFDALGQEIAFLDENLSQQTGMHSKTYHISDLMTGVYFYVVTINDEKQSGRLIISD